MRTTYAALTVLAALAIGCNGSSSDDDNAVDFIGVINAITDPVVDAYDQARQNASAGNDRNINWDGGAVTALTQGGTATFPPDLFLNGAGLRQIIIGGVTGEDVLVSEDAFATLPGGGANPSAGGGFLNLTPNVNFTVRDGNRITVQFTTFDTDVAGEVHGFGAVFTDVEVGDRSGLRFYDRHGNLLRTVFCPAGGDNEHQFVGSVFSSAVVATVEILMGDNGSFGTAAEAPLAGGDDHVMLDDFRFFLSQEAVAFTSFVGTVGSIDDALLDRFDQRRLPLALGQERNVNWDGGAVTALTQGGTADFPPDLFLTGAGLRQLTIGDPGEEVVVSEDAFATLQGGAANPSAQTAGFENLTATVNFSVFEGTTVTVRFFLADQTTPGLVHGFGAIFSDVESSTASLRFFDASGTLLEEVSAASGSNGGDQFVGGLFNEAVVARVDISLPGNGDFGTAVESPPGVDHVVLDDFRFFMAVEAAP